MLPFQKKIQQKQNSHKFTYIFASFCLLLVWSNINTGFCFFELPWNSLFNISLIIRAVLPFVLPFLFIGFYYRQDKRLRSSVNPAWWLGIYGFIALFSSIFSPEPYAAFYWGMAFLMALFVPALFFGQPLNEEFYPERIMIYATWGMLAVFVLGMLYLFGMSVVSEREILGTASSAGQGFSTRSSGLGRFFGAAGIILSVWLFHGKGFSRFLLIIPILFCMRVVWVAQSRGAMFAVLFSFLLILVASRSKWVTFFLVISGLCIVFTLFHASSAQMKTKIMDQFRRGQSNEEFASMTGRTRAYKLAFKQILNKPLLGAGNWADRLIIHEHSHNSYIQAALNAGIIGLLPYIISWLLALQLCVKIYQKLDLLSMEQQYLFLQCAAVTVFFFIRAIPETTTASFSVDQVIMIPVFYYLTVTYFRLEEREKCLKIRGKSIQ